MSPKKEIIENLSPEMPEPNDPYILMKQQNEARDQRMEMLEQQMCNLQETWNRILNIAQEPPRQQQYIPPYPPQFQQQFQQPYIPPYCPPEMQQQPIQQQPIDDPNKPRWEKQAIESKDSKEAQPKKKLGRGTLLIIGAVALIIAVYIFMKIMQGYTIHLPGA